MPIRPLQLSLRFILPLALVIGISALILLPMIDDLTQRWFLRDLDTRGQMVAASIREPLIDYVMLQDVDAMQDLLERAAIDGHLLALGFCDVAGNLRYRSRALPHQVNCLGAAPSAMRVSEVSLEQDENSLGKLLLVQDTVVCTRIGVRVLRAMHILARKTFYACTHIHVYIYTYIYIHTS